MDERRELRRFPRGERCHECGARKWYLEDGLRFCSNGHQVEGFVQFAVGDEEDAGKLGATARREKEIKEKELRHLTGQAGKNLYLECLQLILRNQLLWLVSEKGHREELETVVRDLWDLRIRGSSTLVADDAAGEPALEMFSSQPAASEEQNKSVENPGSRAQIWDPNRGSDWPMPRMIDNPVLCYLGCLLLRIPTRAGELCHWINEGHMPYKRAYYDLPQEMQDRLPSAYTRALKLPLRASLKGSDFHNAILEMALSYNRNYDMVFPAISDTLILVQLVKLLALPVEVLVIARRISIHLDLSFSLPIQKSRVFVIDYPERLLVALVVVSAKLCFPLGGHKGLLPGFTDSQALRLDWDTWQKIMHEIAEPLGQSSGNRDFEKVTVDEVVSMESEELDTYYAYIASRVDKRNDNAITGFFPSESAPALESPRPETTEEQVIDRTARALKESLTVHGVDLEEEDGKDSVSVDDTFAYEAYRAVDQLPDAAKAFYNAAGHIAGLTLEEMVRAVSMLENRIVQWQYSQAPREEDGDDHNTTIEGQIEGLAL